MGNCCSCGRDSAKAAAKKSAADAPAGSPIPAAPANSRQGSGALNSPRGSGTGNSPGRSGAASPHSITQSASPPKGAKRAPSVHSVAQSVVSSSRSHTPVEPPLKSALRRKLAQSDPPPKPSRRMQVQVDLGPRTGRHCLFGPGPELPAAIDQTATLPPLPPTPELRPRQYTTTGLRQRTSISSLFENLPGPSEEAPPRRKDDPSKFEDPRVTSLRKKIRAKNTPKYPDGTPRPDSLPRSRIPPGGINWSSSSSSVRSG